MNDLRKQAIEFLKEYLDMSKPTPEQTNKAHVALTILREYAITHKK